jgi:small-conductance mechanosensitive channel
VPFFDALADEARYALTLWVFVFVLASVIFSRAAGVSRPRLKAIFFFLILHLIGLIVIAGIIDHDPELVYGLRPAVWVFGAWAFVGSSGALLFGVFLPRTRLRTPLIVQDVVVALGMIGATIFVLSRADIELSGLIATSAVVTAILGFSLQDVIGNIAGGLALQADNSIEEGDWIKVGDVVGRVSEIRWRHTAVETRNWETVLIPHTIMTRSNVFILGKRQGQPVQLRRWVHFHVDWRFQPGDVIDVVRTAVCAAKIEGIARVPLPSVVLLEMADTFGRYAVRYHLVDLAADDPTDSEVRACVFFALQRADIKLAMPAHALFLTEETLDRKALKQAERAEQRRQLIDSMELFADLSDDEKTELAAQLRYAPFAKGELMTRQGSEAHWLYLMQEGQATVRVSDGKNEREVARLTGPCFFGEMSLLTGEPRDATVMADSEVECYRLDKAAIKQIIAARPAVMEMMAQAVAQRREALQHARDQLKSTRERSEQNESNAILSKIRSFFALD